MASITPKIFTQPDFDAGDMDSVERFNAAVTESAVVYASPDSNKRVRFAEMVPVTPQDQSTSARLLHPPEVVRVRSITDDDGVAMTGFMTAKAKWVENLKSNYILVADDFMCPGCAGHIGPLFACRDYKARVLHAVYMDDRFDALLMEIEQEVFQSEADNEHAEAT